MPPSEKTSRGYSGPGADGWPSDLRKRPPWVSPVGRRLDSRRPRGRFAAPLGAPGPRDELDGRRAGSRREHGGPDAADVSERPVPPPVVAAAVCGRDVGAVVRRPAARHGHELVALGRARAAGGGAVVYRQAAYVARHALGPEPGEQLAPPRPVRPARVPLRQRPAAVAPGARSSAHPMAVARPVAALAAFVRVAMGAPPGYGEGRPVGRPALASNSP